MFLTLSLWTSLRRACLAGQKPLTRFVPCTFVSNQGSLHAKNMANSTVADEIEDPKEADCRFSARKGTYLRLVASVGGS